jgi:hypothetical protein
LGAERIPGGSERSASHQVRGGTHPCGTLVKVGIQRRPAESGFLSLEHPLLLHQTILELVKCGVVTESAAKLLLGITGQNRLHRIGRRSRDAKLLQHRLGDTGAESVVLGWRILESVDKLAHI